MNIAFLLFTIVSIIFMLINNPEQVIAVMVEGGSNAITLCIKLCAIYAIWLSILKLMDKNNISLWLSRVFKPIVSKIFKGENDKTKEYISLNLATNILGLGGAATPLGLKAMEGMAKGEKASKNMIMLVVINATSIQLLPATVISIRAATGSVSASDIIIPSIIVTFITTITGIILVNLFYKSDKKLK